MKDRMLQLLVGPEARFQIERHGLAPTLFDKWIAASGGPKWLPLAALDRHLFTDFFSPTQPITLLGSSSGSWRSAALCHPDAVKTHLTLQQQYVALPYSKHASAKQMADLCHQMLATVFPQNSRQALLANPHRHLTVITCHGRGLAASENPTLATAAALISTLANAVDRRYLSLFWRRWVLHAKGSNPFTSMTDLPTYSTQLTADGLVDALLASGSIPIMLPGVLDLPNAEPGFYFDGGVTDYHLDLPALQHGKLTLYPHFYPYAVPGWFDKSLPWRRAKANFRKVAMLVPTPEFIAQLPGKRLPDRRDCGHLSEAVRLQQWRQAAELGQQLSDSFAAIQQDPMRYMVNIADAQ